MNEPPIYTQYHPRWYRQRISTWWWMRDWRYLKFIGRELSCLGVAWVVALLLMLLYCVSQGAASYAEFLDLMKSPVMIAVNLIAMCFTLFHTITWFNLAPSAMAVRMGGKRLPDLAIAAPNYLGWVVVSALVWWFLLRG